MSRRGILAGVALAVLLAPSAASAATTHCRVEKPARAVEDVTVALDRLTATNLPKHEPLEGFAVYSSCLMANGLAAQYENRVLDWEMEDPEATEPLQIQFLEGNEWSEPGRWRVHLTDLSHGGEDFLGTSTQAAKWTATFVAGRQRVSVHVAVPDPEGTGGSGAEALPE